MSCEGRNIFDGVADASRNKHLISRSSDNLLIVDGQSQSPDYDGHKLIGRMDEVIPLSSRRIDEHVTGVPPLAPISSHFFAVNGHRKLLRDEIAHGNLAQGKPIHAE